MTNQNVVNQSAESIIAAGNLNLKPADEKPEVLSAEAGMGLDDGNRLRSAMDEADRGLATLARNLFIDRAKQFGGNDAKKREYFSGLRKAFAGIKSVDVRVSEVKAIMDAYDKDSEKVMSITTGGYLALVEGCRTIRGKSPRGAKTGGAKVTDKGMEAIESKVPVMTAGQAKVLADKVITQLVQTSASNWEKAVLLQIEDLAIRLSDSKQPIFADLAETISNECGKVLEKVRIDEAIETAKHSKTEPQASEGAPKPAEFTENDANNAMAEYSKSEAEQEQKQHAQAA